MAIDLLDVVKAGVNALGHLRAAKSSFPSHADEIDEISNSVGKDFPKAQKKLVDLIKTLPLQQGHPNQELMKALGYIAYVNGINDVNDLDL